MEKFWKIKNITNNQVKISVCVNSVVAPGIILQPGQFCISKQQMTAPLDKQFRNNLVAIDKDYDNTKNLDLAKAYDQNILDKEQENVESYIK